MSKKEPNAFLIKFRIALSHSRVKISTYVAVAFTGEETGKKIDRKSVV